MRYTAIICVALMIILAPLAAQEVTIANVFIEPPEIRQGDDLAIRYTLSVVDDDVSATTFAVPGSVEEAPEQWAEVAARVVPRYQIEHRDLAGEPVDCSCRLPGGVTTDLEPGVHSLFVGVAGVGPGWRKLKLGEFVVLDASSFEIIRRTGPAPVAILSDEIEPAGIASDPERIAALVRAAGCEATLLGAGQLADPSVFSRDAYDLLVLPYGGAVPEGAIDNVREFLRRAGALISIGGAPMTSPVSVAPHADAEPLTVADMEGDEPTAEMEIIAGKGTSGVIEVVRDGAAGTGCSLRIAVDRLAGWFYAQIPLEGLARPGDTWIEFQARGDETTDRLCLELVGTDESRWKYFVSLEPRWRGYSVRIRDFAAYVTPGRGTGGDHLAPGELRALKLGFYRDLYEDEAPRAAWIDELRLSPVAHFPSQNPPEQGMQWRTQYQGLRAMPPLDVLGLFRDLRRVEAASTLMPAEGQVIFDRTVELPGRMEAWEMAPGTVKRVAGGWDGDSGDVARWIPLLRLQPEGDAPADVAGILLHHHGDYPGAAVGWLGVSSHDLLADVSGPIAGGFQRMVRTLTAGAFLLAAEPEFVAEDVGVAQTWRTELACRGGEAREFTLTLRPEGALRPVSRQVRLEPGQITEVAFELPAAAIEWERFGGTFEVAAGGETVDALLAVADPEAALRATAEWLIDNQKPEGNFSRFFYADVYGARSMRMLSERTGDRRYWDAAVRATDMFVRDQRPDGGWWVGYGPPRQLVFVADDGCLALGLVQLAPYCEPERRERYLEAARRHIDFRESFRQTDEVVAELREKYGEDHPGILPGGLGIGWVLNDYFADVPPADEPFPEYRQRPWTLHCSLAFLGGLCSLGASARACTLAAQDTRWFLDRIEEGADGVTSGYANECAVWMSETAPEPELREAMREHLREDFLTFARENRGEWWLGSDGRKSLMIPGLVYCMREIDDGPEVQAALARAIWAVSGTASETSVQDIVRRNSTTGNGSVVMYACFSSLGLAELLEPRSTLLPASAVGR